MTKIKICGLMREEDVSAVNTHRPDFAGFILAPSRRRVSFAQAAALSAMLDPAICPVGVFVNEDPEEILRFVNAGVIRAVQLHGQETPDMLAALKKRLAPSGIPVIRAVRMETPDDLAPWQDSKADYLLLDAGSGGTGQTFDHSLLASVGEIKKPWFLAGGMAPENAAAAIRALHPWGIDVSSGVETDGRKDPEKIRRFIEAVRE